jgi:hypothetical protein
MMGLKVSIVAELRGFLVLIELGFEWENIKLEFAKV